MNCFPHVTFLPRITPGESASTMNDVKASPVFAFGFGSERAKTKNLKPKRILYIVYAMIFTLFEVSYRLLFVLILQVRRNTKMTRKTFWNINCTIN